MPGLNGAQTTEAVLAGRRPATRVVCLTASVSRAEVQELYARRRRRLREARTRSSSGSSRRSTRPRSARPPDGADRREHGDRPRLDRRLSRGAATLPELARRAAVRALRRRELSATTSTSARRSSTSGSQRRPSCRRPRSPRPATSPPPTRSWPGYERVLSLQLSSTLSGTFASARRGRGRLRRRRARDRHANRVGGDRDARVRRPAPARARHDRRGDRRRSSPRFRREHELLFTLDTLDYLARGGRIGRASSLVGGLLNVKPILTIRDGEVVPLKRVRGSAKAFAEFAALLEAGSTDAPSLRVGIAHAAAPRAARRGRGARRARAAERADRGGDVARRRRRHARGAGHGRPVLVRRPGLSPPRARSFVGGARRSLVVDAVGGVRTRGVGDRPALLEREQEVAAIGAFVEEAALGPSALVVEGEPGIGKTELWNAGVAQARAPRPARARVAAGGSRDAALVRGAARPARRRLRRRRWRAARAAAARARGGAALRGGRRGRPGRAHDRGRDARRAAVARRRRAAARRDRRRAVDRRRLGGRARLSRSAGSGRAACRSWSDAGRARRGPRRCRSRAPSPGARRSRSPRPARRHRDRAS